MPDQHDLAEEALADALVSAYTADWPKSIGGPQRFVDLTKNAKRAWRMEARRLLDAPHKIAAIRAAAVEEERERLLSEKAIEAAKDALKGAPRPSSYLQNHHLRAAMQAALDSDSEEESDG